MVRLSHALGIAFLFAGSLLSSAQATHTCKVDHNTPTDADNALARRDFKDSDDLYTAALKDRPADTPSTLGLIRSQLGEGRLYDALALAKKLLADHPAEASSQEAMGEVELRRGEPEEAVNAFNRALNIDPCDPSIHFDVYHYYNLAGLRASARKQLDLAHNLSPRQPVIDRAWRAASTVPPLPEQMIAQLKTRSEDPNLPPEQKAGIAETIRSIEAHQRGDCQAVNQVPSTTLPMVALSNGPTRPLFAVGLDVQMNGKRKRLEIDTGASGLLISRGSAISAGLIPEAEIKANGIGDAGPTGAFVTHVDNLRIGNMEFHNCMVRVLEKRSVLEVDGLIGTDIFRNYVVTLDTPGRELRLTPLPKRPDDVAKPETLDTAGEAGSAPSLPQDRYVAPEMKDWTPIYRVGHQLIGATRIGKAPQKLFILDSGAATPLISPEAAREVTHVDSDVEAHIHGISGQVKEVSEADNVTISFAHVQQRLRGMYSIDTTNISRSYGVEIAGFIAFPTVSELVLSIDYRDNLIHVVYDPGHGIHAH